MPQNDDDLRSCLPVWHGHLTAHDLRVRDLMELQAEGLADVLGMRESYLDDVDYLMAPQMHAHLVDALGMSGIYEARIRATGEVYTCPAWCASADHPTAAIFDPLSGGPGHFADVEGEGVTVSAGPGEAPRIHCEQAECMTAAEARQLAAALLNAADALDSITGC